MNPFIDFSEAEALPEDVTPDVLNSEPVQEFIKARFNSVYEERFETEAKGLKRTNQELKEEKTRIKEMLDRYKDIDVEEFKQLKEFRENNGDAGKQLAQMQAQLEVQQAEIQGIEESYQNKLQLVARDKEQIEAQLYSERLQNEVRSGIAIHNADYPQVGIKKGNERWIVEEANKVWKRDEDGNFMPMNGDRVMTGPSGKVMTYPEWINSLRNRPDFKDMFHQPTGGGATGGNGKGNIPFNPRDMAGSTEERQSAIKARWNLTE